MIEIVDNLADRVVRQGYFPADGFNCYCYGDYKCGRWYSFFTRDYDENSCCVRVTECNGTIEVKALKYLDVSSHAFLQRFFEKSPEGAVYPMVEVSRTEGICVNPARGFWYDDYMRDNIEGVRSSRCIKVDDGEETMTVQYYYAGQSVSKSVRTIILPKIDLEQFGAYDEGIVESRVTAKSHLDRIFARPSGNPHSKRLAMINWLDSRGFSEEEKKELLRPFDFTPTTKNGRAFKKRKNKAN